MSGVAEHILTSIMTPSPHEVEIAQLRLQLEAANKVALAAMDRAKGLQAEVDRMAPEFEAILAVNDGLRAEVATLQGRISDLEEQEVGHD